MSNKENKRYLPVGSASSLLSPKLSLFLPSLSWIIKLKLCHSASSLPFYQKLKLSTFLCCAADLLCFESSVKDRALRFHFFRWREWIFLVFFFPHIFLLFPFSRLFFLLFFLRFCWNCNFQSGKKKRDRGKLRVGIYWLEKRVRWKRIDHARDQKTKSFIFQESKRQLAERSEAKNVKRSFASK